MLQEWEDGGGYDVGCFETAMKGLVFGSVMFASSSEACLVLRYSSVHVYKRLCRLRGYTRYLGRPGTCSRAPSPGAQPILHSVTQFPVIQDGQDYRAWDVIPDTLDMNAV